MAVFECSALFNLLLLYKKIVAPSDLFLCMPACMATVLVLNYQFKELADSSGGNHLDGAI